MRAGELRHRLTLQEPGQARNSFGDMVTTWTDVATVWGAVEWAGGRRYLEAAQLNAEVQGVVRIRYRADIDTTWRVKFDSRLFTILSMSNYRERGEELWLNIKEALD